MSDKSRGVCDTGHCRGSHAPPDRLVDRATDCQNVARAQQGGEREGGGDGRAVGAGAYRNVVANRPPDEGTDARVEQVLHQDVLGVLGTDSARLEEREAALHEEDEEAAHHQPQDVADLAIEVDTSGPLRDHRINSGCRDRHSCTRARGQGDSAWKVFGQKASPAKMFGVVWGTRYGCEGDQV